jgi:hypothetical protein
MKLPRILCCLAPLLLALPAAAQDGTTAGEGLAMQADSRTYAAFADRVLALLVAGDGEGFRALISPTVLANATPEQIDGYIEGQVLPFFADFASPGREQTITDTTHPAGFTGFAFYRSFTAADGSTKPFVLYVLDEGGRLVVGNLLVGRTFQDLHPQQ